MLSPVMPVATARASTVVLFALAGTMIAIHTFVLGLAAQRTSLGARARIVVPVGAAAFLAAWFATAVVVADQTNFPLAHASSALPIALGVLLVPVVIALAALVRFTPIREINNAMPASWLIRLQVYRVAGFIFLFPFLAYGVIPAAFAITAAIGDILTGAFALPVAALVERRGIAALGRARLWNAFGILDLIVVPTVAVLTGANVITHYPLGTIALFVGPPLGILTHIYSLRNLGTLSRGSAPTRALSPAAVRHA